MTPTIVRSVEDARRVSEFHRDIGNILTPEVKGSPMMRNLQVKPESGSEIDSIETEPGSMKVLPLGEPQRVTPRPTNGPSYVPDAPRYGPVVPNTTNAMVRGAAPNQRRVPLVQCTHRRHEADLSLCASPRAHFFNGIERLHDRVT